MGKRCLPGGNLGRSERTRIQSPVLQYAHHAVIAQDRNLGCSIAIPNEISQGESIRMETKLDGYAPWSAIERLVNYNCTRS
jgi:hypothetical protein